MGALQNRIIKPNHGHYHIFTIVCGAGNHGVNDIRIKNHLKKYFEK